MMRFVLFLIKAHPPASAILRQYFTLFIIRDCSFYMTIHFFGLFRIRALKTLHNYNICTHLQCTVSIILHWFHREAFKALQCC